MSPVPKKGHASMSLIAWVMWIHAQGPNTDSWSSLPGFSSEKQCMASVTEKLQTWSQFRDATFNGLSVTFTENKMTLSYSCLTDDEDPRKAQPKRRAR